MSPSESAQFQEAGFFPDCGEDLEYDPDFLALQQAAAGKSEQQFGATIIPAESPDWNEVEKIAAGLLERTCDIRVMAYLARARAELQGLPGYAATLERLAEALESRWDGIHPRLQQDDEDDPMPRMNALAALADPSGAGRSVRAAVLIQGDYASASLRDAELMLEGVRADSVQYPGGRARLLEDLRIAQARGEPSALAVLGARRALRRIGATVSERLGAAWLPDFSSVEGALDRVCQVLEDSPAAAAPAEPAQATGQVLHLQPRAPAARPAEEGQAWRNASLQTRADAVAMLDKVRSYFEAFEPSHPAPLLIQRIQQLIPLDFYEIVENLAPQGLDQVETLMPRRRAAGDRAS